MPANMDLAVLGLEIRSDGVATASQRLKEFQTQATATQTATQKLQQEQQAAVQSTKGMTGAVGGLVSGLKKAAAAMIALVAASKTFGLISRQVSSGFAYNEQLEKAQLGIASVIASTLNLADAQGKVLEGQEKFNAAQKLSVEMAKALDVASMASPAGYTDLLSTFQRLLAPASQLGLQWQDTLDITIKMSNVLSSLGLDMERLGKETEAILTGKRLNESEVAKRLGITKQEIASWGEGAKLLENFEKRFEAMKYAGIAVEDTMEAVRAYYEDVIANMSGEAVAGLFDKVKESLLEVADSIYVIDEETKKFRLSDEFAPLVELANTASEALGDVLVSSVKSAMSVVKDFGRWVESVGGGAAAFEKITNAVKMLAPALLALAAAKRAASATFTVGAGDTAQQVTGLRQYIALQYESVKAAQLRAKQEEVAALAQRQSAAAALAKFKADSQSAVAVRNATQAEVIRAAQQKQQVALTNAVTQAEVRYQAAVKASQAATLSATAARTAVGGLMAMLGGPVGVAVTALTLGISALALRTDETTEATNALSKAEQSYADAIKGATSETGKLNEKLSEAQKLKMDLAKEDLQTAIDKQFAALSEKFSRIPTKEGLARNDWWGTADFDTAIPEHFSHGLTLLTASFKQGGMSAQEYADKIAQIRQAAISAGYGNSEFVKTLGEVSRDEGAVAKLVALAEKLAKIEDAAKGAADGVQILKSATSGIGASLDAALADANLEAHISGLGKQQQAVAKALVKDLGIKEVGTLKDVLSGKQMAGVDSGKLKEFIDLQNQIYRNNQRMSSSGASAASKRDTANESIRRLRDEIDQLTGSSDKATAAMSKKLYEIGKMGKEAGISAAEISKLSAEYRDAFKANTLRDFDKEVLKLTGSSSKLRQLEIAETVAQWADRFEAAGIKAAEAEPKLEKIKQALESKSRYENLQVAADFYKELGQLSGNYGLSLDYQNQLLEEQARLWESIGIATDDINARIELMKQEMAQDPFSGFARGARKFGAEYADLAGRIEDLTRNMGNTIANSLADGFMKGKFSAQDFFSSLVSMAAQAISNYAVGSLLGGLGGLFGGTFSAGQSATMSANGMQTGFGGWLTGVHGHHDGGIVGQSSTFQRNVPLAAFANAPRFHSGGGFFGPDEYPAILKAGERVLNEQETKAYRPGAYSPGEVAFAPQIRVNITNASGTPMQAEVSTESDGNGNMDMNVILREVDKGMAGLANGGRSAFAKHMEKAYGLSRATTLQRNKA